MWFHGMHVFVDWRSVKSFNKLWFSVLQYCQPFFHLNSLEEMFNMIKAEVFKTLILIWLGSDEDSGSQVDNSIFQSLQLKSGKSSQPERNTNCEGWVLRIIWRLDLETLTGCNKIKEKGNKLIWKLCCVPMISLTNCQSLWIQNRCWPQNLS